MNKRNLSLLLAIIAGEAIFMLPFLIPRLYRPLMIETWNLTNTDIGLAFSAYGFSAMISYIIGGPFADKYHPRFLMASSLALTSIGGFSLIYLHSATNLIFTYFMFGISTTFLMWGALIKLTHQIGGEDNRASAMGLLDAGRGLTAAIMSSVIIFAISFFINEANVDSNAASLTLTYTLVACFNLAVAVLIVYGLKGLDFASTSSSKWSLKESIEVLKRLDIWLLGIIILSSYCGYKSVDNYSIYLVDILNFDLKESSHFTSLIFWLRPLSAFMAGFVADYLGRKIKGGRFLNLFILLIFASILQFIMTTNIQSLTTLILFIVLISSALAYALRAIYFAVFGDLNIPGHLIGTTVGIVSLVGFLPDMFFGTLTGYLIDNNEGSVGYNYVFMFTGTAMLIGSICSLFCYLRSKKTITFK
jgi:MFS family permease